MPVRVPVEKNILLWAVSVSDKTIEDAHQKFPKFNEWLKGTWAPTFNQLKELSKFTRVPFGYLMLKEPPEENIELLEFRTIDTEYIEQPSRELIDTINEMRYRQEWMRDYLIRESYPTNELVAALPTQKITNTKEAAHFILDQLDLPTDWKKYSRKQPYNYLKQVISNHGILVMQNGVVKNNNYRKLNLDEFRAFTMLDDYAPLIFINNNDTMNGKLFSLLHELMHIFIGESSFYNENIQMRKDKYQNENEIFANAVTAEILLPENKFLRQWQEHNLNPLEKIIKISEQELVSMAVVARTALENHLINQNKYQEAVKVNISYAEEARKHAKEKRGGDFHNTQLSRIDVNFLYALSNGLNTGTANFTDVYKLTGLSRKNYNTIEQKLIAKE